MHSLETKKQFPELDGDANPQVTHIVLLLIFPFLIKVIQIPGGGLAKRFLTGCEEKGVQVLRIH